MTNDLVSDMLTRIRNASLAKHNFTRAKYSKLNLAILNVLQSEGYIKNYLLIHTEIPEKLSYAENQNCIFLGK
jgi:small subunit ribosomal protein S8